MPSLALSSNVFVIKIIAFLRNYDMNRSIYFNYRPDIACSSLTMILSTNCIFRPPALYPCYTNICKGKIFDTS